MQHEFQIENLDELNYIVHGIFSISGKTHTELPRIYDLVKIVDMYILFDFLPIDHGR